MAKEAVKLEFSGENMEELINRIIQFLSMIKGIGMSAKEQKKDED